MFTGIITGVGRIAATRHLGSSLQHGRRVVIETPPAYLADVAMGDSIAINGACMTVAAFDVVTCRFEIDVSAESLARTGGWDDNSAVNLEKALRATDRLGGHLVAGHVDGIGAVVRFGPVGESFELLIAAPRGIAKYLAYKGSIAVNGVSLTVNAINDTAAGAVCSINLIPHTIQNTALSSLSEGAKVNLEVDLVARYVERMMSVSAAPPAEPVSTPLTERAS